MKLVFSCFESSEDRYIDYTLEYDSKEKFINDFKNTYNNATKSKSEKFQFMNTSFYMYSFDINSISAIELDEWFEANKL